MLSIYLLLNHITLFIPDLGLKGWKHSFKLNKSSLFLSTVKYDKDESSLSTKNCDKVEDSKASV